MAQSSIGIIRSVTTSDVTPLPDGVCEAIWVGGAGAIAIKDEAGNSVVLGGMQAGMWHRIRASHILTTGTVATGIFVGY